MFKILLPLIKKDILLFFLRGGGFGQAILLGLLLIFVFSLSQNIGEQISARAVATLFWLASTFSMILIFNSLHSIEEHNNAKTALSLMPSPIHTLWFAKVLSGFLFMIISQIFFFLAILVFCNIVLHNPIFEVLTNLVLIDIGMTACGALLGALAIGQGGKESLLSIILFPLLTPLLLAGIEIFSALFTQEELVPQSWFIMALAFDALFIALALILFPFIYNVDE